jgi:hypothetical protein
MSGILPDEPEELVDGTFALVDADEELECLTDHCVHRSGMFRCFHPSASKHLVVDRDRHISHRSSVTLVLWSSGQVETSGKQQALPPEHDRLWRHA